jgi:CheY-like chemotaxis protein
MNALRILLADDSEDVRELVTLRAQDLGYHIETVADGAALLERLEGGPAGFDVVVTDYKMPGGPTGLEVLTKLKRGRTDFEETPVILHSGSLDVGLSETVEELDGICCAKNESYDCLFAALAELAKD